jgi:hypothetical protein
MEQLPLILKFQFSNNSKRGDDLLPYKNPPLVLTTAGKASLLCTQSFEAIRK